MTGRNEEEKEQLLVVRKVVRDDPLDPGHHPGVP